MAPDKLTQLDQKIQLLKKRKDKIQSQLALSYLKETQKIFKEDFSPELALTVLNQAWAVASESQKQEWKKRGHSFPIPPSHSSGKKPSPLNATPHQS